jgi:ankyrin repeat protein
MAPLKLLHPQLAMPILHLLLAHGADLSLQDARGNTALAQARHQGLTDVVAVLEKVA